MYGLTLLFVWKNNAKIGFIVLFLHKTIISVLNIHFLN